MYANYWTRQQLCLLTFCHSSRCTDGLLLGRERWVFWVERMSYHVLMFQESNNNNNHAGSEGPVQQDFVPHVARIFKLMEARVIFTFFRY